jgi:hypothetical protein
MLLKALPKNKNKSKLGPKVLSKIKKIQHGFNHFEC